MASCNSTPVIVASSDFGPPMWRDFFINYRPPPLQMPEKCLKDRANVLKEKVCGLFEASKDVIEQMNLVDTFEHLGIGHHFENHITNALRNIQSMEFNSSSLHEVSLRFRLLREHGLGISPDEFNRFKSTDGRFNIDTLDDPRGLLSLYNAAHLLTHDEPVLEEAIAFARLHLESARHNLKYPLSEQVKRALHCPLPRTVRRVETLHYMSEYQHEPAYYPVILELAKIDFNILQRLHIEELRAISVWWQDFYAEVALSFARDRIVELYLWSYAVYYEQEYSRARIVLTKLFALATMLDDMHDIRATLEDSQKFDEAIQRWDENVVPILPDYLKKFYLRIINSFKEIEDVLESHEKYKVSYAKKSFQTMSKYHIRAREWFHHNYMPKFKEKLEVSIMETGGPFTSVALLVGMGDIATKEALEWALGCTEAVKASGVLPRFLNDITALKHGNRKQDVANCVECYIAEYGVTSEVAVAKINQMMEDTWKNVNKALLEFHSLRPAVKRVVDLIVSCTLMYGDKKDVFTFGDDLGEVINQLFVNPIPI